jgi:SAM-dependent methyltransferase
VRLRIPQLTPTIEERLEQAVGDVESVLDVGCGANSPLGRFRRRVARAVGVDAHEPAVAAARAAGVHDEYVVADVRELGSRFPPRSFDAVVAFDVVEHLRREEGEALLDAMERVARRRVVVLTPNGFVEQREYDANPLQEHRSAWSAADFARRGYRVRGVAGLRWLRGERGEVRLRPTWLWSRVAGASEPLVTRVPALAFQLIAVKNV